MLVTSWKVDAFHVHECMVFEFAYLPTQTALELPLVFPFSEFSGVCMQVIFNPISIFVTVLQAMQVIIMSNFPIVLQSVFLQLQCSQVLQGPFRRYQI